MRKKTFKKYLAEFFAEKEPDVHVVYVFVRKDIPIFAQAVQVAHACLEAGYRFADRMPTQEPIHLILLKVDDEHGLMWANRRANAAGAQTSLFFEPDPESLGGKKGSYTSFATEPLVREKWRAMFESYELWEVR